MQHKITLNQAVVPHSEDKTGRDALVTLFSVTIYITFCRKTKKTSRDKFSKFPCSTKKYKRKTYAHIFLTIKLK